MKKLFIVILAIVAGTGISKADTRFVKANDAGAGTSWDDAYGNLQDAIDASSAGDMIWVAEGTYYPSYKPNGATDRDKTFLLKSGVKIYGGFAGTESALSQQNWNENQTILSGELNADGTPGNDGDATNNTYHVVASINNDAQTLLDGFTITGGYSHTYGEWADWHPWDGVEHPANRDWSSGGASVGDEYITRNNGAGIIGFKTNAVFVNLKITGNQTARRGMGSGVYFYNANNTVCHAYLLNSLVTGNTTAYAHESWGDFLGYAAVALMNEGTGLSVINTTITKNYNGGIYSDGAAEMFVINSIVYNNPCTPLFVEHNMNITVKNKYIYNRWTEGIGDVPVGKVFKSITDNPLWSPASAYMAISDNPQFTDEENGDFTLDYLYSPGIDAGDNAYLTVKDINDNVIYDIEKDLKGKVRVYNDYVDVGAYEYSEEVTYVPCSEFNIPLLPSGKTIDLNSSAIEPVWDLSFTRILDNPVVSSAIENPAGSWCAVYDDNNIYVLVKINDTSYAANQGYNGDAVEIYFRRTSSMSNEGQWGYGYSDNGTTGGNAFAYALTADENQRVSGSHIMWNTDAGYVLKAAIPRSAIDEVEMAMEVAVNQANAGTERLAQVATWEKANSDMYRDPTGYTPVKLVTECPSIDLNVSANRITEGDIITLTACNISEPEGLDFTWYKSAFDFATLAWVTEEIAGKTESEITDIPLVKTIYKVKYNDKFSPEVTVLVDPLSLAETCDSELTELLAETFGSLTSSVCSRSDLSVDAKSGAARVKGLTYSEGHVIPGTYAVIKNAGETCFGETDDEPWFTDDFDHTYNNNGAMLLVNNAGAGSVLYSNIIEVPEAEEKTEFSLFLANAMFDENKTKSVNLDLAVYVFTGESDTQAELANESNWALINRVETGEILPSGQSNRLAWVESKIAFNLSGYDYFKIAVENNIETNAGFAILIDDIAIKQCSNKTSIPSTTDNDNLVTIYPNPGSVNEAVIVRSSFAEGMKVTVLNILGNIAYEIDSASPVVELPVALTSGYYLVRVTGNSGKTITRKLIVR